MRLSIVLLLLATTLSPSLADEKDKSREENADQALDRRVMALIGQDREAELQSRIAALEERIAQLEARLPRELPQGAAPGRVVADPPRLVADPSRHINRFPQTLMRRRPTQAAHAQEAPSRFPSAESVPVISQATEIPADGFASQIPNPIHPSHRPWQRFQVNGQSFYIVPVSELEQRPNTNTNPPVHGDSFRNR